MENPLFLFPHLNISSLKEKTYCKATKSTNKEETNKEIKTRSKEKRNRLSLLLQKTEFHENVNLEKFENLTKGSSGNFEINEEYMQLDIFDKEYMEFYKKNAVSQNNMTFEKCLCVTPEEAVRWGESFDKLLSQKGRTMPSTTENKELICNFKFDFSFNKSNVTIRDTMKGSFNKQKKAGLDAFTRFLKTEFSEENIEFWTACEDYKKNRVSHQLLPKAKTIYETFIRKDAPKEVNLDFHTKEVTAQNITHPTLDSFDAAQAKVYRLMEQDSYPRFLKSDMYLDLIKGRQHSGHPALRRRSRSFTVNEFQDVQSDFTIWL